MKWAREYEDVQKDSKNNQTDQMTTNSNETNTRKPPIKSKSFFGFLSAEQLKNQQSIKVESNESEQKSDSIETIEQLEEFGELPFSDELRSKWNGFQSREIQSKVFTRWINSMIAPFNHSIGSVVDDLGDGLFIESFHSICL